MKTTNVDHDKSCSTNMIVTYPGPKGIEIVNNGKKIDGIGKYIDENGYIKTVLTKNSQKDLKKYKEKYGMER